MEETLSQDKKATMTQHTSVNVADFEKLMILMQELPKPLNFRKKFKVILEYDPEKKVVEISYFLED